MTVACSVYSQTHGIGNWLLNLSVGVEAHDKRLFNYSEKESLLERQPEFWGTNHIGLQIQRKIFDKDRISVIIGSGFSFENSDFIRPIDQSYFDDELKDLRVTNSYTKYHTDLIFSGFYLLNANWVVTGDMESKFLLDKNINNTETTSDVFPLQESSLEFSTIALKIGLFYRINKFWIGLNSRIANYQKIDKIIFNDIIKDPRTDQIWEWNNPIRFDMTIGYMW